MSQKKVTFEEALADDDFGLIIDKDGNLKGLFMPEGKQENEFVPDTIVTILESVYGLDLGDEVTIH
jgi:hypothetical protein